MALKGTLKDFSMADIFQLISLQRKTGILKVNREGEEITISFLNGCIVWADTSKRELEERLGQVLLKNGKLTAHQLERALDLQKMTLQRLGHIMVAEGLIKEDDLKDALNRQAKLIVYRLFRWNDGEYDFDQEAVLDYDRDHFSPLSAESIMMECARMTDEWQIIERKVKPKDVFAKVHREDELAVEEAESIIDEDIDFGFSEKGESTESSTIKMSPDAAIIYNLIDGKSPVEAITKKSDLGDFETLRIILELLNRNLIRKTEMLEASDARAAAMKIEARSTWTWVFPVAVVFLAVVSVILFPTTFPGSSVVNSYNRYRNEMMIDLSKAKLEKIDKILTVYYFSTGKFPSRLEELLSGAYMNDVDLVDPWKKNYGYALFDDAYKLAGLNAFNREDRRLTITNNFSNLQKVIIQSSIAEGKNKTFGFAAELP